MSANPLLSGVVAMVYPIAEIFESIQGEGQWAGTPMTFIRLAGCTVGRPYSAGARGTLGLQLYQERCQLWDGAAFTCDTNYKKSKSLSVLELLALPEVQRATRVCLTGGEPMMHKVQELIAALIVRQKIVHLETSGTISLTALALEHTRGLWLCVSPKVDCLPESLLQAHEIKVLVHPDFDENKFVSVYKLFFKKVWLQPVNAEHSVNWDNVERCKQLQAKYRELRLSIQLHKIMQVR